MGMFEGAAVHEAETEELDADDETVADMIDEPEAELEVELGELEAELLEKELDGELEDMLEAELLESELDGELEDVLEAELLESELDGELEDVLKTELDETELDEAEQHAGALKSGANWKAVYP
jgi:hypothetical protein